MHDRSEIRGNIFTRHGNLTDVQSDWATYTNIHTEQKARPITIHKGNIYINSLALQYSTD